MKTTKFAGGMVLLVSTIIMLASTACLGGSKNYSGSAQAAGTSGSTAGQIGVRQGNTAPDFTLKDLDGGTVRLADLKGKPVMVNFWATWCPPCREEMPVLQKAYQKYRDQGYVFLGVDLKESPETVRDFVQKGGYEWTFLLDASGQVASDYRVTGVPTTYFIDRLGIVQDSYIGPITATTLETKLGKIK